MALEKLDFGRALWPGQTKTPGVLTLALHGMYVVMLACIIEFQVNELICGDTQKDHVETLPKPHTVPDWGLESYP